MKIREYFSRNERNRRTLERGKAPRHERVAAEVKSRTPIVRDRINPAHGRPHRDDVESHKIRDEGLANRKRVSDQQKAAEKVCRQRWEAQDREYEASREKAKADRAARADERDNGWERDPDAFRGRPAQRPGRTAR